MRYISFLCLLMAVASSAFAINEGQELRTKLDLAMDQAVAQKRIVGSVVIVSHKGKVVYHRAAGFSDRESNILMKNDSIFRLASLTKPLVATAALALVDKGILTLDEPITKWLPEFSPQLANGQDASITVRQLLSHTSGLNYGFFEPANGPYHMAGVSDGSDDVNFSMTENLRRLSSVPLLFPPGVAWQYSLSYDVFGEVIERASGKTLAQVVRDLVTGPLKMNDTAFVVARSERVTTPYMNSAPEPTAMTERQEVPFGLSSVVFSPNRIFDEKAYASGGSGMAATAMDYMIFLEEIRQNTGTILDKKTTESLTTNQIGDFNVFIAPGCGWSLGFMVVKDAVVAQSLPAKGTYQWSGAYGNTFFVDPTNELSVVVLTNTTLEGMVGQYPKDIQGAIYLK